jgi:hypothetical protein
MSIYNPGCGEITPPVCQDCPTKELGRVRHFWLQKVTYTFADITDAAEWATAICNGDVYVFPYANGTIEQAELLSDGYGNVPQTLDSYEFTGNLHEPQYKNNIAFWNDVKRSNQFLFGYCTQTLGHLSEVPAMFFPKAPVSADVKSKIDLNIMVKFVQEDLIEPFVFPTSVFDVCVACA